MGSNQSGVLTDWRRFLFFERGCLKRMNEHTLKLVKCQKAVANIKWMLIWKGCILRAIFVGEWSKLEWGLNCLQNMNVMLQTKPCSFENVTKLWLSTRNSALSSHVFILTYKRKSFPQFDCLWAPFCIRFFRSCPPLPRDHSRCRVIRSVCSFFLYRKRYFGVYEPIYF